jgi:DNA-binding transcriptional MerR regulator
MTLALAVLLLVTPPQVSQDSTEALREHVQELEARISTLEERQDIRRGYYLDTLWGERTAYAALLTLIGGLFVLINFAVVQWRIRKSEEEAEEKIETKGNIIKNETEEYVDSEISDLDSEINHVNEFATDQIVEIRVGLKRLNREYKKEAAEIYEILEEKEAVP